MDHLEEIPLDRIQRALEAVEGSKATQRLTAAIAYKNGVTQTELAEWYGVERRTIYSWLDRLDGGPIEEAVTDDERGGRPRKLDDSERARLERALLEPPTEAGYEAGSWTPTLVRRYVDDRFGVSYSRPSCRRLMREAGLRYQRPAPTPDDGDDGTASGSGRWLPR
jgi:transposase